MKYNIELGTYRSTRKSIVKNIFLWYNIMEKILKKIWNLYLLAVADSYLPLCVFIKGVGKMLELEDNLKELQSLKSKIESLGESL